MPEYLVKIGINYTPKGGKIEVRREPGEVVSDLTAQAAKALQEAGAIVPAEEG